MREPAPERGGAHFERAGIRLLHGFCSVRLTIALLLVLGVAAMIGGVLPQAPTTLNADTIYSSYGAFWKGAIKALWLDDVFHSPWFAVLLAVFALHLALCTAGRVPRVTRKVFRPAVPDPSEPGNALFLETQAFPAEAEGAVRRWLTSRHFRVRAVGEWLLADRRRWSCFSADIVHASILIVLVGAFLGVYGTDGYFTASETEIGKTVPFRLASGKDSFGVRVDAFGVETYPSTGTTKDYWAQLSVMRDGALVESLETRVNQPATYHGVSFFQTTYGDDVDSVRAVLAAVERTTGIVMGTASLRLGEAGIISAAGLDVRLVRFFRSLRWTQSGSPVDAPSSAPNPAALIEVHSHGEGTWLQTMVYPRFSPHESAASSIVLVLSSYDVPKVVGIRYSRNPGYPVVWSGLALMVVALTVAFYFPAQRVWIRIDVACSQVELRAEPSRGLARGAMWLRRVQQGMEAALRGGR